MGRISKILLAPGSRKEVKCAAPTQKVAILEHDPEKNSGIVCENENKYSTAAKPRILDRWFDKVVEASGSEVVYITILIALFTWAFLGIRFGQSNTWQIIISDAQAIINMVFDAFLMRQQLNSHDSLVIVAASLRSRASSHKRMLNKLIASGKYKSILPASFQQLKQADFASQLPTETWTGRISTALSVFIGHIATVCAFWVCVFIWIGLGHYSGWSTTWQLYMNSATSAFMVFMLAFLANIRERHIKYENKCLEAIWEVDTALELRLRTASGDTIENPPVLVPVPKRSRIQRAIDYYADLVGTLAGIAILFFVIIVWLAVGPALHFNSNWWLLIGTYAGLIGMHDGFVLRNVCTVLGDYEDEQFNYVGHDDMDMLAAIGVQKLEEERITDQSLTCRISVRMGAICSHELTVVFGALTIVGLIIGASAMRWSVTGQLLCNVPPSIIETFFTMILITGHNIGEAKRRVDLYNVYLRRLKLVSYTDAEAHDESIPKA